MDEEALRAAASRIKQSYKNAQVILFGSTARGTDSPDNDLDLCIVIENPKKRLRDISRKIINVRRFQKSNIFVTPGLFACPRDSVISPYAGVLMKKSVFLLVILQFTPGIIG